MDKLIKWISITDRFSKIYLNTRFKKLGINSSQHMFIKHICANEGISQDKLVNLVHINKSNVTRALNQLEKNGFIEKHENEKDKRTALLYPTTKAREILSEIFQIENDWVEIMTKNLEAEDNELLLRLMKNVAQTSVEFVRNEV